MSGGRLNLTARSSFTKLAGLASSSSVLASSLNVANSVTTELVAAEVVVVNSEHLGDERSTMTDAALPGTVGRTTVHH